MLLAQVDKLDSICVQGNESAQVTFHNSHTATRTPQLARRVWVVPAALSLRTAAAPVGPIVADWLID